MPLWLRRRPLIKRSLGRDVWDGYDPFPEQGYPGVTVTPVLSQPMLHRYGVRGKEGYLG